MESNGEVRSDLFPRFYPFVFCERCRFPEVRHAPFSQSKSKIKLLINTFLKQNSDRLISQDEITNLFFFSFPFHPQNLGFLFRFGSEGSCKRGGLRCAQRLLVHSGELGRGYLLRSASLDRFSRADVQREGAAVQARTESNQPEAALRAAKLA